MRPLILITAMFALSASAMAADAPSTQPAFPATRPAVAANGGVHGRLSLPATWDLQPPDLSRSIVYLSEDPLLAAVALRPGTASMVQQDKTFIPSLLVVPVGTAVEFPNRDHISHNVFSRSKAAPAFDLDRYPYGFSKTRVFDKVGVVQVFCNIHQQMRAMIVVTPNQFFSRVDASGNFELKDVPAGQHELVVWNERCEPQHHMIEIPAGEALQAHFALEQNRRSIIASEQPVHQRGYGVERGLNVKREKLDLPVVTESHPAPQQPAPH